MARMGRRPNPAEREIAQVLPNPLGTPEWILM
jgi:hypothetical protein